LTFGYFKILLFLLMKKTGMLYLFMLVWCLCAVDKIAAQGMGYGAPPPDDFKVGEKEETIKRKELTLFGSRPSKENPADQLEYARSLEAAGKKRRAIRAYDALVRKWHSTPQAVEAQFSIAKLLDGMGKYKAAFNEYQYLIQYFSSGFPYDEVMDCQYRIANHIMTQRHWKFMCLPGFTSPEDSLPLWETILKNAPSWEKAPQILYTIANIYEKNSKFEESLSAYTRLRNEYPSSEFILEADYGRVKSLYEIARQRPRDEEACRDALSALTMFIRDYPEYPGLKEIKEKQEEMRNKLEEMYYNRARFYEKGSHRNPKSAIFAYQEFIKRFPSSRYSIEAMKRIEVLEAEIKENNERKNNKE